MTISIVIPAYNEAGRIAATLSKVLAWFDVQRLSGEIIVVDDGSRDGTAALVQQFVATDSRVRLISHAKNTGKGAAVRTGMLAAQGEAVLMTDADLSTPIEETRKLLDELKQADIVIGSRAVPEARLTKPQNLCRRSMGKAFNIIIRSVGLSGFRDTQCGFKLWRIDAARTVFNQTKIDGFAFDVESLSIAARSGLSIVEVGVIWHNSPESRVKILKDSILMLRDVLKIRQETVRKL